MIGRWSVNMVRSLPMSSGLQWSKAAQIEASSALKAEYLLSLIHI